MPTPVPYANDVMARFEAELESLRDDHQIYVLVRVTCPGLPDPELLMLHGKSEEVRLAACAAAARVATCCEFNGWCPDEVGYLLSEFKDYTAGQAREGDALLTWVRRPNG